MLRVVGFDKMATPGLIRHNNGLFENSIQTEGNVININSSTVLKYISEARFFKYFYFILLYTYYI